MFEIETLDMTITRSDIIMSGLVENPQPPSIKVNSTFPVVPTTEETIALALNPLSDVIETTSPTI